MKINKYIYGWKVQQNWGYGHGWEDVAFEDTYREAYSQVKCYRANQPECPVRIVRGRELNQAVQS
jgi:hypothetical protein